MVSQSRGYEITASLQDLQTWDIDMRSRCREVVDCASIAILETTSAGAELAMFIEAHIVRVWYKSLESSVSCLKTFGSRLAPNGLL